MKAISIKQPWAWAIAEGHKTIETRTWSTNYRGELLIVSSKKPDKDMLFFLPDAWVNWIGVNVTNDMLLYGQALCIADLVDCHPMKPEEADKALCSIYTDAQSWVFENIRKIDPFPVKGQLNIYSVDVNL